MLIAAGSEIAWFENQRPPRSTIPALPAFPRALLVAALLWVSLRAIRRLRSG